MKNASQKLLLGIGLWWVCFIIMSVTATNPLQSLNIIGFTALMLIPGILTIALSPIRILSVWAYIGLAVGISILELIVVALAGNTVLPFFGIAHPLEQFVLVGELCALVGGLWIFAWRKASREIAYGNFYFVRPTIRENVFLFLPVVFVVLSVFGAVRLNNGGDGLFTMLMLGGAALYVVFLMRNLERIRENVIPTAIFFLALALLLMTSLRGWYITGHDIQWEYRVFQLAKSSNFWTMASYRDAYNACMSITILPTIFANMLRLPDPYVYKVLFQILFAITPVFVYLLARRFTSKLLAFLGTFFFIIFPTFFSDMPFLDRQEIAFLFLAIMLYFIFVDEIPLRLRRWIFMLAGAGVILSHYSTTYTIIIVMGLTVVAMSIVTRLFAWLTHFRFFAETALTVGPLDNKGRYGRITFGMVSLLVVMSFIWTALITGTGGHTKQVILDTLGAVKDGFLENNRSIDAVSLFTFGKPSQADELKDYVEKVVTPLRDAAPSGTYYDESTYAQYSLTPTFVGTLPVSPLGSFVNTFWHAAGLIPILGALLAKCMELMIPVGVVYVLIRNKVIRTIDLEFYLIGGFSMLFVAMNILLPVLSTEYGVFRALQQALFVLAPMMAAGSIILSLWVVRMIGYVRRRFFHGPSQSDTDRSSAAANVSIVIAALLFAYATAFMPQLFGGNEPMLHLNNAGPYYDYYYVHRSDVTAIKWLSIQAEEYAAQGREQFQLQADKYDQSKIGSLSNLGYTVGIFPGLVMTDSYVYLDEVVVDRGRSAFGYNGDFITYAYPYEFIASRKNLLYTNGEVEIYH